MAGRPFFHEPLNISHCIIQSPLLPISPRLLAQYWLLIACCSLCCPKSASVTESCDSILGASTYLYSSLTGSDCRLDEALLYVATPRRPQGVSLRKGIPLMGFSFGCMWRAVFCIFFLTVAIF
jgi:hypothetical protein